MIFVDGCECRGVWKYGNSCHLWIEGEPIENLHIFAESIGLKRKWFQNSPMLPHYDLTANKRKLAVLKGAKEVGRIDLVKAIKKNREIIIKSDNTL